MALQCYTRWTVRYDCVAGFGSISSVNACIDDSLAITSWTIVDRGDFYCDYEVDVALDADCSDDGDCTSLPLSSEPLLPSPMDCSCPSTRCYSRWTVTYDCINGFGSVVSIGNVCIDPGTAYTTWTITSTGSFLCNYTIDVALGSACSVAGDCPGMSAPPIPPDPSGCSCPSTRCYTRWTVRYDCGCGLGSMSSQNICIDPLTAYTSWTKTGFGASYCDYTIDMPLDAACALNGDCSSLSPLPPTPSTPDTSDCTCPSTRCYTQWTVRYDCVTGFGSMSNQNVCIDPTSAMLSWTITATGSYYCDYTIDVPLINCPTFDGVCESNTDCSAISPQPPSPSEPDSSTCTCPTNRCYTRWSVRYDCACGFGSMTSENLCLNPGSAQITWAPSSSGNYYCDYYIDVPLGTACTSDGDCSGVSPQPPSPSYPDTSECSCPTNRCYTQWTVRYDCVTGFGTPSSENVCIDPSTAVTSWMLTDTGSFYCDYLIQVPQANCSEGVDGVCVTTGDCPTSPQPPTPSEPNPSGCDCPSTRCFTHWTVVYTCGTGFGTPTPVNVCIYPGSALSTWTVTSTTSTTCTYEVDVALGTECAVPDDCTGTADAPALPNPASCACPPPPTSCIPTTICPPPDCQCPLTAQPITNSIPAHAVMGSVSLGAGVPTMKMPLLRTRAVGGDAASMNLDVNYYPDVECDCAASVECPDSSEEMGLRRGFAPLVMSSSTSASDRVLGIGFDFYQYGRLIDLTGGGAQLFTGQHTIEVFRPDGSGGYISDNNTSAVLQRSGAGTSADTFRLVARDGTVSVFFGTYSSIATPGRLQSITDRFGNTQSFSWTTMDGRPRLLSVTDSYGRVTNFAYFGPEVGYKLKQVQDFDGRQVTFQYDTLEHLVAIVLPAITRGANENANTFPNGTAYAFEYDVNNPRPQRQDDLIKVFAPNQVAPFLDATRTVNVAGVYASATPRSTFEYGQDPTDALTWGRVISHISGDPINGVGGTYFFSYATSGLPSNLIDPSDPIVSRTSVTDRNDNQTVYDFNTEKMVVRQEAFANRDKNSLEATSWVTWTKFNAHNQPLTIVMPEGNSVEYAYEDETNTIQFSGIPYGRRIGLLKSTTRLPGNSIGIPSRAGSGPSGGVQNELTTRQFSDPLFGTVCASIEERGNPIDTGLYFPPQNGGTTPTDTDRSRYATVHFLDYQKDATLVVQFDPVLLTQLGLSPTQIGDLIAFVNTQMTATDGTGGIPTGFPTFLGDINGEGTGNGTGFNARHTGSIVKTQYPSVRQLVPNTGSGDPWLWQTQLRSALFTNNAKGQQTTATDPEGNLTVFVRFPENDPEGAGQFLVPSLSNQQYGFLKEVDVDADPNTVMSLIGSDGDMINFIGGLISRTNTPGVYQDLVTRYQPSGSAGCTSCAYDPLGNPLSVTDPRGFTTSYQRNELGEVYRTTTDAPYSQSVETYYDANRNVTRIDTQDKQVLFDSIDPTDPRYGHFTPTGTGSSSSLEDGSTANLPVQNGPGGAVRPGWFTNLFTFDILNNKIEDDVDATGSTPANLVTSYLYDPNQNLVQITKPAGNIVEYDYDERDLRIATRVGYDPANGVDGSVTVTVFDGNGNSTAVIGPMQRGTTSQSLTVTINDGFRSASAMTHTGDYVAQQVYDGFDRTIQNIDAVGGVIGNTFDPGSRVIATATYGTAGGPTPTDRTGSLNVQLATSSARFDEAGRAYEQQQNVFLNTGVGSSALPSGRTATHTGGGLAANSTTNTNTATVTLTTGGASYILTRVVFDRSGRTTASATDNTAITSYTYDGASRQLSMSDPLGNVVQNSFDGNGNIVSATRVEKCTITGVTTVESFASQMRYDLLNRMIVSVQQGPDGILNSDMTADGNQTLFTLVGYDSRDNRTNLVDPKQNSTVWTYDGASRQLDHIRQMRIDGDGTQPIFQSVTNTNDYDGNGRVIRLVDDRGGTTTWNYDTLDRQTLMTFHDGSTRVSTFDAASDLTGNVDENGSEFANSFDVLGRRVAVAITRATGVVGTTAQSFQYDGISRMTFGRDTVVTVNCDAAFAFDSLSRFVEEGQTYASDTRCVTHDKWTSLPWTDLTYPNNRQVTSGYDALYRRNTINETSGGASIAAWQFFGGRTATVVLGNGITCSFMNNAQTNSAVQVGVPLPAWGDKTTDRLGYDGSERLVAKRFLPSASTTALVGFTTAYDPSSNKLFERALHAESRSTIYPGYDSMDRLREYQRGVLATGGASITTPITLPGTDSQRSYNLDNLGNWQNITYTPEGGSSTSAIRQHNKLNAITQFGSTAVAYDHGSNAGNPNPLFAQRGNGNITADGTRSYQYDALNRLLFVGRTTDDDQIAAYTYDALGRRIRKQVTNGGVSGTITNATYRYLYDRQQIVEELLIGGSTTTLRQFVWGQYIDELLQLKTYANTGTQPLAAGSYYPLQDLLYRTIASTDSSGMIVEAYDYDAYGNTLMYSGPGTDSTWFTDDDVATLQPACECLFTGRQYDPETEIFSYRARYFNPQLGRFSARDPIGYAADLNLYAAFSSNPAMVVDPYGWAPNWIGERPLTAAERAQLLIYVCVLKLLGYIGNKGASGLTALINSANGIHIATPATSSLRGQTTVDMPDFGMPSHIIISTYIFSSQFYGPETLLHEYLHYTSDSVMNAGYKLVENLGFDFLSVPAIWGTAVSDRLMALDSGKHRFIRKCPCQQPDTWTHLDVIFCVCGDGSHCKAKCPLPSIDFSMFVHSNALYGLTENENWRPNPQGHR